VRAGAAGQRLARRNPSRCCGVPFRAGGAAGTRVHDAMAGAALASQGVAERVDPGVPFRQASIRSHSRRPTYAPLHHDSALVMSPFDRQARV
jgi:hypothetical protein